MITWRQILQGTVRRFLPAAAVTTLILGAPNWLVEGVRSLSLVPVVGLGALAFGYAATLGVLRSHLREDADVAGRRALVSGVASVGLLAAGLATLHLSTPPFVPGLGRIAAVYFASSSLVTLGLYFPWLTRIQRGARELGTSAMTGHELQSGEPKGADPQRPRPAAEAFWRLLSFRGAKRRGIYSACSRR
jgi:hypothetical protein